jgi:iron complex outermembrane recepter protein
MSPTYSHFAALALATLGGVSAIHAQEAKSNDDGREALEEVIVTATPLKHDRDFLSTIVGSVDRSQILQNGGAQLADALANQAGVTGTGFAAGDPRL